MHDKCYGNMINICGPDPNAVYYVTYNRDGCSGCSKSNYLLYSAANDPLTTHDPRTANDPALKIGMSWNRVMGSFLVN